MVSSSERNTSDNNFSDFNFGPTVVGFFGKIIDGKGDVPQVDILHINVAQRRWVLLLYQLLEDADSFSLVDFDSEHPIGIITDKKAVERETLRKIKSCGCLDHF
jgi:hypothetical protein